MDSGKKPSFTKIIQTDYVAMIGLLFPLVSWGLYLLLDIVNGFAPGRAAPAMTRAESLPFLLSMGIVATAVGLAVIVVRYYTISSVFWNGVEVPGQIASADFYRDRGRVEYIYHFMGETYRRSAALHKTRLTESLCPGMDVIVVVDRSDPRRALIRDLYC